MRRYHLASFPFPIRQFPKKPFCFSILRFFRLDNVVKIPNRGSRLAKYLRVHPQQFDQIFARHGGGLKRELRAVVINEMHEGHEVIFSDVRQNEKGLVSLQQDIGHERTAGREDCSMHGHVADSVLSEEDVQI